MSSDNLEQAKKSLEQFFKNGNKITSAGDEHQLMVAKIFLKLLARPLLLEMGLGQQPVQLLDVACGTGVITQEAQDLLPKNVLEKSSFLSTDNSLALVDLVKKRIDVEGWVNATAEVHDALVRFRGYSST